MASIWETHDSNDVDSESNSDAVQEGGSSQDEAEAHNQNEEPNAETAGYDI